MPEPRHLNNAPIREAIVDFRIKTRRELQLADLVPVLESLKDEYPLVEEQHTAETTIRVSPQVASSETTVRQLGLQGYVLKSRDGLNVTQLRVSGFTFNRLAPYTRWEEIRPLALDAWRKYAEIARPEAVTRLGLRYINHIPLPPGVHELDDYLVAGPRTPPEWPQDLSAFLTYVVLHEPDSGVAVAVRQWLQVGIGRPEVAVVLDIDAYSEKQRDPDSLEIERVLGDLRTVKNRIFFGSLTDRAMRLFE